MTDDCFPWEEHVYQPLVEVVVAIMILSADDQLNIQTGFQKTEEGLILPTSALSPKKFASETAAELVCHHTYTNKRWVNVQFIGFFDSLHHAEEEPRTIRFLYRSKLPQIIKRKDKLEWLNHGELARSSRKLVGDYQRLFTAAFNC